MDDSPPPFEDVDFDKVQLPADEQEDDQEEAKAELTEEPKVEEAQVEEPTAKPTDLFEDDEDEPPALSDPPPAQVEASAAPTLETREIEEVEVVPPKPVVREPAKTLDLFEDEPTSKRDKKEEEEEESGDTFELEITIGNPEKVGDGMGAYMTYSVTTKTTMPSFKSPETTVRRRFSDFLGLHQRLTEKHMQNGLIVPPAPEKSVSGMTRVKFSKSEENSAAFIEKRKAALERYLNRLAKHPLLRKEDDFQDFLENPTDLPKASDTSALSGAGFMRLMKNVGESISKIASKKSESDSWFEEQQQSYEALDGHLKKLHQGVETMIICRKDVCSNTSAFVKSVATLGNVEENNSVSRALSKLSEVEERVESLHQEQLNSDLFVFGETVKDYIALLASIRGNFQLRLKGYNTWQSAQNTLAKKRESEQKLQGGGKPEKIAQIKYEIKEWEEKVEEGQRNFESCSKTLKKEILRFETERAQEFKTKFVAYLEGMMHMQQELIRLWEGYLPDAQAIETS